MVTNLTGPGSIEQASLCGLLSQLGHRPAKSSGDELLYQNVLRKCEASPTFAVNTQLGLWFDRLTKKSGDILDFGLAYWAGLTAIEVSEKISKLCNLHAASSTVEDGRSHRRRRAIKVPYYHVAEVLPLGGNAEIMNFLKAQRIWEISIGHIKEVYYYVIDEKRRRKDFFAAGWKNENGGWEVRGRNFTGCLGPNGMTFISGDANRLVVFEEYTDYLNWKYEYKNPGSSALVLNSPDFLHAAKTRIAKFKDVNILVKDEQLAHQLLTATDRPANP